MEKNHRLQRQLLLNFPATSVSLSACTARFHSNALGFRTLIRGRQSRQREKSKARGDENDVKTEERTRGGRTGN